MHLGEEKINKKKGIRMISFNVGGRQLANKSVVFFFEY
nr:MAG TPA: hypothetical protein [Caudoviricetes sp.]